MVRSIGSECLSVPGRDFPKAGEYWCRYHRTFDNWDVLQMTFVLPSRVCFLGIAHVIVTAIERPKSSQKSCGNV